MVYNPAEGNESTYILSSSITQSGRDMLSKIQSASIGGTRKKKRYRYSNGTKTNFHRKKYKANRNKSNISRLFRTYKRLKEKCNIR
jgi:hypothetical protein